MKVLKKHCVFDMDGVLIDSLPWIEKAYRHAGVPILEQDRYKSWKEWLVPLYGMTMATRIHDKKNEFYSLMLSARIVKKLPPAQVLEKFHTMCSIATGASATSVLAVKKYVGFGDECKVGVCEASAEDKIAYLVNLHNISNKYGYYFDDNAEVGQGIVDEANRKIGKDVWKFYHYVEQTFDEIMKEVSKPWQM